MFPLSFPPSSVKRARLVAISLGVVALSLGGCSSAEFHLVSPSEELVNDMLSSGIDTEVVECVEGMAVADERFDVIDLADSQDKSYIEDLKLSCQQAAILGAPPQEQPEEIPFAGPHTYGDDLELDLLWDECAAGFGEKCDKLFELAPVDTEYENFGVTCGERPGVLNCAELEPS